MKAYAVRTQSEFLGPLQHRYDVFLVSAEFFREPKHAAAVIDAYAYVYPGAGSDSRDFFQLRKRIKGKPVHAVFKSLRNMRRRLNRSPINHLLGRHSHSLENSKFM